MNNQGYWQVRVLGADGRWGEDRYLKTYPLLCADLQRRARVWKWSPSGWRKLASGTWMNVVSEAPRVIVYVRWLPVTPPDKQGG